MSRRDPKGSEKRLSGEIGGPAAGIPPPDRRKGFLQAPNSPEPGSESLAATLARRKAMASRILAGGLSAVPTLDELDAMTLDEFDLTGLDSLISQDQMAKIYSAAQYGASVEEISYLTGVPVGMLETKFVKLIQAGDAKGRVTLRKAQMRNALMGDTPMLVWLGRQRLSQGTTIAATTNVSPEMVEQANQAFASIMQARDFKNEEPAERVRTFPVGIDAEEGVESESPEVGGGAGEGGEVEALPVWPAIDVGGAEERSPTRFHFDATKLAESPFSAPIEDTSDAIFIWDS